MDLRRLLAAVEASAPVDVVDALASELARTVEATEVSLLIANFGGNAVARLSHVTGAGALHDGHNERVESVPLPGSVHESVLLEQRLDVTQTRGAWLVLVPVTERGDAIGILELVLRERPDEDTLQYLVAAAHALAYVLIASRRHTDLFEWAQRDIPFSLAAEIQRRLLPSAYTAEGGAFTVAGWLEPAHNAGGDTFDYSVDREYLYASLTDAMGHSTEAAMLATLTVGSLRNTRRSLASVVDQANRASTELRAQARADQFVTGLLGRICLVDGSTELINAGHPAPYLVRGGHAEVVDLITEPPLGVHASPYRSQALKLEPGDRLLLITDGYLERGAGRVDIEQILTSTLGRHPRQIVLELAHQVLEATGGRLTDDATAVCIDWYGEAGIRDATGGASQARATAS